MSAFPIFCVPYAGAGATLYRGWPLPADAGVAIVPVQLAGREERFADDLYPSFDAAVADVVSCVRAHAGGEPYALFGHSFGAIVAFETARLLCGDPQTAPAQLIVSGSAEPGLPLGRRSAHLDDDAFVARVESLAGYVHPALSDPELRELVLPPLRADVALHESYRPPSREPLPVPITVLRGSRDHQVTAVACAGWRDWTSAGFAYRELDGGHMFLAEDPGAVVRALTDAVLERDAALS